MKVSELLKKLGIDVNEKIEDDNEEKTPNPKEEETNPKPKEEPKKELSENDLLIKSLRDEIEQYKATISSKDEIINQNNEQIKALKDLTSTNSPITDEIESLEQYILDNKGVI